MPTKPIAIDPNRQARRYVVRDAKGNVICRHKVTPQLWSMPTGWTVTVSTAKRGRA